MAIATAAHAQDTELTPVPKPVGEPGPASQWTVLAGAMFGGNGKLFDDSPTPYTVDFFSTAFSPPDPNHPHEPPVGFFAGAQCKDEATPFDQLEECKREPAVYQIATDERGDQRITKVPGVGGGSGYVGAIAWLYKDPDGAGPLEGEYTAYAVGGFGTYPRREPATPVDDPQYVDPAGDARAWLYKDPDGAGPLAGQWRELQDLTDGKEGDELPDAMSGMTALACGVGAVHPNVRGRCLAGGLQRLWWLPPPSGVTEAIVTPAQVTNSSGQPDFRFRARSIAFGGTPAVLVATSGCCTVPGGPPSGARILSFHGVTKKWRSDQPDTLSLSPSRVAADATGNAGSAALADSYYALTNSATKGAAVVASPGGPSTTAGTVEPGSRIMRLAPAANVSPRHWSTEIGADLTAASLDSVRLLAAAGDFAGPPTSGNEIAGQTGSDWDPGLDGIPDWSVGSLKQGSAEGRAEGVAYTTNPAFIPVPNPLSCTLSTASSGCTPIPERLTEADTKSRRLVGMGTYALNSIGFVPVKAGTEAWAAGGRGALARLGGAGSVGSQNEPPAPPLRSRSATSLADREPFDSHRPLTTATLGVVPPLTDQPLETLAEPALLPYGSANPMPPLTSIESTSGFAMARDGSEGWAFGSNDGSVPYHFDGERWVRCVQWNPDEEKLGPPDEACRSLLDAGAGTEFTAIARIPLERDGDPTNDKEFAAMALGTKALIYRNGSWESDPSGAPVSLSRQVSIAFRTPEDGWLTGRLDDGGKFFLYHYSVDEDEEWPDGQWHGCGSGKDNDFDVGECGKGGSSLPLDTSGGNLQTQLAGDTVFVAGTRTLTGGATYPFVATRNLASGAPWRMEYDPGCPESQTEPPPSAAPACSGSPDAEKLGRVSSFSVVQRGDGKITGWLLGRFGASTGTGFSADTLDATREVTGQDMLMRRDPASSKWSVRTVEDAAADFLPTGQGGAKVMSFRGPGGEERSVIVSDSWLNTGRHPWLTYDPDRDRWRVLPTPFVSNLKTDSLARQAAAIASDPDGQGGFWVAVRQGFSLVLQNPDEPERQVPTYYYHYTDRAPKAVFEDAPHPVREPISAIDGNSEGTVWVSTYSDRLYRYDRLGGWERAPIPGWDPGRTVPRPSAALAIAVNDAGVGIAVGKEGRIADISSRAVRLDSASGRRCSDDPAPPCGTPRDLRAAAVAPDGSALAGGKNLTLMWRPAGGDFRLVEAPLISADTVITDITMPDANRAWMTTQAGEIWAGTLDRGEWSWERESAASAAADESGWSRLNAIEIDASNHGLAVGDRGAMLERSSDGSWQRLETGYLDNLYSIALPPSGYGDGTLVGGSVGVILTRVDGGFHLARQSDIFDPLTNAGGAPMAARIVGAVLSGGVFEGEVEAWAASQVPVEAWSRRDPAPTALLHYASGANPLLDSRARAVALPDAPAPAPQELAFAAFGRSECQLSGHPRFCPEFQGSNMLSEVVTRRIQEEVAERAADAQDDLAALFTGDINTAPGREEQWGRSLSVVGRPNTPLDVNATQNAWRDLVAEQLVEDGVSIFAALGKADLSGLSECVNPSVCPGTRDITDAALSLQWRQSFAGMPSPWGQGEPAESEGLEFEPVGETLLSGVEPPGEGAKTHYAADVIRDGEPIARLVVVDNSLGSLAESTVNQNPVEEQQVWLENALCFEGSADDTDGDVRDCTRERGQEAIVLANYPTYTYAASISPTDLATDGSLFEATLLRYDVDALITGRLGWNGLYYACAPGLHYPPPGQGYPKRAPKGLAECLAASGGADAPDELAELSSKATDTVSGTPTGALPVVVASGGGGRFGPRGDLQGSASEGYWRGYSVVRVDPDTGEVIVEQRPVLDWVGLDADKHVLDPGERVELHGYGREPAAIDVPLRYIEIDSPAVTHRYDLLLADPDQPWLPCLATDADCVKLVGRLEGPRSLGSASGEAARSARDDSSSLSSRAQASRSDAVAEGSGPGNPCDPYLCLPESVATVDDQSGEVRAGAGKHPGTYAIAMLSIGDHVATQPLYFKKSPSFIVFAAFGLPELPSPPTSATTAPAPPPPPTPSQPNVPQPNLPEVPLPPPVPPIAAADPPEPQPPAPPAPPPPTEQPAPLDLTISPTALTVATPAAVIQPPTPPVNPAPPSGARREARQRQAATQKSGAGSEEEGTENPDAISQVDLIKDAQGNAATRREQPSPRELSATRRDRARPEQSLTAIRATEQPSAWVRGLLYTGGLGVCALVLALGAGALRPTPRVREPRLPAPASAWACRRMR